MADFTRLVARPHYRIGKRYFELEDLQKKVGSSYKLYGDFKRKVILKAQKELKKHTNIAFAFHEKKKGRKVIGVEFIIFGNKPERKNPDQLSLLEDAIENIKDAEKPALSESIIKAMNALGISEQNIAKYLAMGFKIVIEEKKRDAVIERCQTLQDYYLEKLELTRLSADKENSAGYFIKALKEDWTNNKTAKKAKAIANTKEINLAKKQLNQLNQQIEKLSSQKRELKSSIIENLIADKTILEKAYHAVLKDMSDYMKEHISNVLHLPIKEQYENAVAINSGVGVYLIKHFTNHFKEVSILDSQIEKKQKEVQKIKQNHPSIR